MFVHICLVKNDFRNLKKRLVNKGLTWSEGENSCRKKVSDKRSSFPLFKRVCKNTDLLCYDMDLMPHSVLNHF